MKFFQFFFGVILLLLLLSSCNDDSYIEGQDDDGNFPLTVGTSQRVSDDMILTIEKITDNRCPIGSVCSSLGYIQIDMELYYNKTYSDLSINYSTQYQSNCDTINGYTISIISVTPYPYADEEAIDTLNYRITTSVEKM